ncbi:BatD family protein [Flavobacteriales bacterium]|nr:BatD family protein [Flavobacteriales bacterium]MDB4088727.1 BatD family protein [Flavobacteriales bacterium]
MKRISQATAIIFFMILSSLGFSQDIEFTTSTNGVKKAGITDRFQITYSVNVRGQFSLPKYKYFKAVGRVSQGVSNDLMRDMNTGKATVKTTYTYEVVLQPTKLGTHKIEGAKIKVGNVVYESNTVTMEVVKESQARQRRAQDPFEQMRKMQEEMMRGMQGRRQQQQSVEIGEKDFFGRINVSKLNPYKNEQFLVTYKLYTKNFNFGLEKYDFPTQEGFWSENIEIAEGTKPKIETVDGQQYQVFTVKKEILFPQQVGKLKLNSFNLTARIQTSPFSPPISKTIKSNAPTIVVKSLPGNAPNSFVNQVGDLTMKVVFNADSIIVDQPIDLKLTISGKGNLKQLADLKLNFPEEFEMYDPETKNKLRVNEGGVSGSVTYNYLLIPRETGVYDIDPIKFTYFDLATKSYKTITSKAFTIKAYNEDGTIDETVKVDNKVIEENLSESGGGKNYTWLYILIPSLIFGGIAIYYLIFVKKSKEETEEERRKNARKKLAKKMEVAKTHLDNNNIAEFYNETLLGLNKYVNEKLQIQTAKMTKESISESLSNKGVEDRTTQSFIQVLEKCEMAIYAPLSPQNNLEIYEQSIDVIEEIEKTI